MCAGRKDVFHRRELFGNKASHLAHGAVLDDDGQIKAAAHQINAFHLMVGVDLACDLVKAHALLRGDFDFDQCGDAFLCGFVPVDNGFITQNGRIFFKSPDGLGDLFLACASHGGKLGGCQARVLTEQIQQLFRIFHDNNLLFESVCSHRNVEVPAVWLIIHQSGRSCPL